MRVAVVAVRGGAGDDDAVIRVRRMARLLAERGHEVAVFCSQWWAGKSTERTENGVRYIAVTQAQDSRTWFSTAVGLSLRRFHPDIIHSCYDPPVAVVGAKVGAILSRAPLVVDWYGTIQSPGNHRTRRLAWWVADRIIVPSRMVARWVREMGVASDEITIVPESIDFSLVRNLPTFGRADVVYSHRLDETANLDNVLLALAELRERAWEAVVIGDGPHRERFEQQATELRIDDRVSFVGEQPLEDRIARYRGAHVFVQTATREPFARELLWALAAGCVGVVEYQSASSAHELVEHRDRGIRTTSDRELSEAITDATRFDRMAVNEEFSNYDHDTVVAQLLTCYNRLLEGPGSSHS